MKQGQHNPDTGRTVPRQWSSCSHTRQEKAVTATRNRHATTARKDSFGNMQGRRGVDQ